MAYEYKREAKKILGLSDKVNLKFNNFYLGLHKSEDNEGYFYCTLTIPKFKDDDGYELELSFSDYLREEPEQSTRDTRYYEPQYDPEKDAVVNICEYEPELEMGIDPFEKYSALCCGMSFSDLAEGSEFLFEEKIERGQHILLLTLKIKETSYYGYAFIDRELYLKNT